MLPELRQLGFQPGVQQLNVKTTLDYKMQQIGEAVVRSNLAANLYGATRSGQLSSGLIAEDPKTGEILVMVGSPNYNAKAGQINYTTIPRNMGSSMKPYTYGAVINARAATVDTPVYDGPSPLIYKDAYSTTKFYNYDDRTHGVLPLKKAMGNSLNIAAVKVELSIGVPAVLTYMRNLGVLPRYITAERRVQTQCRARRCTARASRSAATRSRCSSTSSGIATYADMGVYHSPEAILSVTDSHGQVLYQTHPNQRARAALDPGVAFIMAQIMSDDQNRCLIFGCNSALHWSNRQVAAKTGTTDNFKDAVTIAFTPTSRPRSGSATSSNNNYTMVQGSDGVFVASPGMHTFIAQALAGVPGNRWYAKPADVVGGPGNSWFLSDTRSIAKLPATAGRSRPRSRSPSSCRRTRAPARSWRARRPSESKPVADSDLCILPPGCKP